MQSKKARSSHTGLYQGLCFKKAVSLLDYVQTSLEQALKNCHIGVMTHGLKNTGPLRPRLKDSKQKSIYFTSV